MSISRQFKDIPNIVADPSKTAGHFGVGVKGSGKSALGERIAEKHYHHGYIVFDGLDGNDIESGFWAVPGPSGRYYPTLLVIPPWYEAKLTNPHYSHVKPISSEVGLLPILQKAEAEHRIITMCCRLWPRGTVGNVLKEWLFEMTEVAPRLNHPVFVLMREIGSYAFSQLRIFPELEDAFRRSLIWLFREGRHHNISFYFDAHRYIDLHKSIRALCDFTHIKLSSKEMIPKEKQWVFEEIKEWREKVPPKRWKLRERTYPRIQKLWANEFYTTGYFEELRPVHKFHMANFHHKNPRDNFEKITGFTFKFDHALFQAYLEEEKQKKTPKRELVFMLLLKYPNLPNYRIAELAKCDPSYVGKLKTRIKNWNPEETGLPTN